MRNYKLAGFLAVVGAILAAAYMLRLLKQIVWGRTDKRDIKDMKVREFVYLIPLVIFVIWMGLFPQPFIGGIEKTLSNLFTQMQPYLH